MNLRTAAAIDHAPSRRSAHLFGLVLIDHLGQSFPLRTLNATTLDPVGAYFYPTTRFVFPDNAEAPAFTSEWDERGAVTGLAAHYYRVKDIRFVRR